jgi:bifunctional non-homologous end joining protein LigD
VSLADYRRKRVLARTPEPKGGTTPQRSRHLDRGMFVIQKHDARRLHYDFRLEMEGVLRSWAIPRGPSLNPSEKRLAVMVEDHPFEYRNFEGIIPAGNYGAGSVIVWDRGEYLATDPPGDIARSVRAGKVDIELTGLKLNGGFILVRTGRSRQKPDDGRQWLLIKKRDAYATDADILAQRPRSVLSGLTNDEIRSSSKIIHRLSQQLNDAQVERFDRPLTEINFTPQLARLHHDPFDSDAWLFELKYDGVRVIAVRDGDVTQLRSRNAKDISERYPEIREAVQALPFERLVLDGEIVALDERDHPSFERLQRRIAMTDPAEIAHQALVHPVCCFLFDLLSFDRFDLRKLPLIRRKAMLSEMIRGDTILRYCDHVAGRGRSLFDAAAREGLEGIIAKRAASHYSGTRSADWLKIKCPRTTTAVIGGWTPPKGGRIRFGALLLGQYDPEGNLHYIGRAGSGFDEPTLRTIGDLIAPLATSTSPFRRGGSAPPRGSRFCRPELVCEIRYADLTSRGLLRHPTFIRMREEVAPMECHIPAPSNEQPVMLDEDWSSRRAQPTKGFVPTNTGKVFWPIEGYTKGDLIDYYRSVASWMLPYLKDRPVVLTRYPDGIEGKSFFQKDAPTFAPSWIRTVQIRSKESGRDISYFILEDAESLAYMANLGVIPIHIWSSRASNLEHPDWLLFDLDPKDAPTARTVSVARTLGAILRKLGLRPYVKTSGQRGIHVMVGLADVYTYEQARMFTELVARLVVSRISDISTLNREPGKRKGRIYIDYLQLGPGKTVAAPYAVRPLPGAPVSAPLKWTELAVTLEPARFNIRTMPRRLKRMRQDPFRGVLDNSQRLEPALAKLEKLVGDTAD